MNFSFYLREAVSDVADAKILGPYPDTTYSVELDYQLAPSQALEQVDTFITPASLPNVLTWTPGDYTLELEVANATSVGFCVEFWRADLNGNDLEIIGARAAIQTLSGAAPVNVLGASFVINDPTGSSLNLTDRLKVKLFAQNNDSVNAQEFSIMCSESAMNTQIPIPSEATNFFNPYRRGRFLGFIFRKSESAEYFDKNGVNLEGWNW